MSVIQRSESISMIEYVNQLEGKWNVTTVDLVQAIKNVCI